MRIRKLLRITGRLILVGCGFRTIAVHADGLFFVTPSISTAGVYDDNLFSLSTAPQTDRFIRYSPGIDAGYRSIPFNLKGGYVIDVERYHSHPELNSDRARQNATLDVGYEIDRTMKILANAAYLKTQTPSELTPQTGLQFMRARAEQINFNPSLSYRFDHLNTGTLSYGYTRDKLDGYIGNDVNSATIDFDHKKSRRVTGSLRYRFERFNFDTGYSIATHAILGGGSMRVTPQTEFVFLAGPRFSDGSVDPEISSSLRHKLDQGEVGITYVKTITSVFGFTSAVDTSSIGVAFSYSFWPAFEMRLAPSYYSSRNNGYQAGAFNTSLEVGYRITPYLKLFGTYQFNSQRGSLNTPVFSEIKRNVAMLGFTFSTPERSETTVRDKAGHSPASNLYYKDRMTTPTEQSTGGEE